VAPAYILSLVGLMCVGIGGLMLAPMGVSLLYGEEAWRAFLGGGLASAALGAVVYWLFRQPRPRELSHREGMAVVGLSWAVAGLLGGVPLFFSGELASFTDAVFESTSGFTTTGASVLTQVESAAKGVLFWRALTHWLGGMGFVVLSLAILPLLGVGGMQLYRAEVPSPTPDRLAPRLADTASALWKVYAGLTAAEALLLMACGLDWFEALCQAFATMATGGFSTRSASIAGFESAAVEWVVALFMVLAGMNFSLHFHLFRRKRLRAWWNDEEWRFYIRVFAGFALLVAAGLWAAAGAGLGEGLRLAAFQTATILTTTGFATADYSLWPSWCLGLLLPLMFVGGSAGSTGGGPKVMRVLVVLKQSASELRRLVHPRVVAPVRLNGHTVERQVVSSVYSFMGLYLGVFVVIGLILAGLGLDLVDAFSAAIACLGNIGPGLGSVGPAGNYAHLSDAAKWILSLAMIVGRLEVYTVLVLLVPDFWRR
jgi:trk system potassium uptake protein TrkH